MSIEIKQLSKFEVETFKKLLAVFADSFDDTDREANKIPDDTYLADVLAKPDFYALVALRDGEVLGGLTAYELMLPTKKSKELYIYDLAVNAQYRRQGVASALLEGLRTIAKEKDIALFFVEAETEDKEAVSFYRSLGGEQLSVEHFNIRV